MILARSSTLVPRPQPSCASCPRAIASLSASSVMVSYSLTVSPVAGLTTAYRVLICLLLRVLVSVLLYSSVAARERTRPVRRRPAEASAEALGRGGAERGVVGGIGDERAGAQGDDGGEDAGEEGSLHVHTATL